MLGKYCKKIIIPHELFLFISISVGKYFTVGGDSPLSPPINQSNVFIMINKSEQVKITFYKKILSSFYLTKELYYIFISISVVQQP